jgi:ABC-type branched-subunit amino acid transport system ATPase component
MTGLLTAEGVTVNFGGLVAVNAVTLSVPTGAIHGVIGPNGAGKTTFFNAIAGLVAVAPGRIAFDGGDITSLPPYQRARLGIRRTFQAVQLIPQFTVLENVLVGLHHDIRENYLTSLFGWSGRSAAEEEAQERTMEVLRFLGLTDAVFKRPRELSFAEQRFVEIARALVARPKLLLLDEPAAGLSSQEVASINALLRRLRAEWGTTIVLVEHVLSLVLDVSDRVSVLDNGKLIAEGAPREVEADPRVRAVYIGEDHA